MLCLRMLPAKLRCLKICVGQCCVGIAYSHGLSEFDCHYYYQGPQPELGGPTAPKAGCKRIRTLGCKRHLRCKASECKKMGLQFVSKLLRLGVAQRQASQETTFVSQPDTTLTKLCIALATFAPSDNVHKRLWLTCTSSRLLPTACWPEGIHSKGPRRDQ